MSLPSSPTNRRQLIVRFGFDFHCPQTIDISTLDHWLARTLNIRVTVSHGDSNTAPSAPSALAFLARALRLAQAMLQAGRIPAFDPPQILSLKPVSDTELWRAEVGLPLVEHLPANSFGLAIKKSIRLCRWAASTPPANEQTIARFFRTLEKEIVAPLRSHTPGGKSTIPVLNAAYQLGIPFTHLGAGVYQLGWGWRAQLMDRSTTAADSAIGAKLSHSKTVTASLLRTAGLPAPTHALVMTDQAGLAAAQRLGWPVVIKPSDRDRGEGVTVDISTPTDLCNAMAAVREISPDKPVIVERQVDGICHRLFIAHGQLLYAVKRLPMSIRGDGTHTVLELVTEELIQQSRKPPWQRSEIRPIDAAAITAMNAAGFSADSVPGAGTLVPLRRIESTEWGGVDEDVSHCIHPVNLDIALRAVELFRLQVAGVDIITPDIARPWFENGAIINEVNFAPLLGGGEISRQHIPMFLHRLLGGNGRIPVEVFTGGSAALAAAKKRWESLVEAGTASYLTSHNLTLAPSGREIVYPTHSAYARTRALLLSPATEAIVAVIQTDEFLETGLPFEFIDQLTATDNELSLHLNNTHPATVERCEQLIHLLHRNVDHTSG